MFDRNGRVQVVVGVVVVGVVGVGGVGVGVGGVGVGVVGVEVEVIFVVFKLCFESRFSFPSSFLLNLVGRSMESSSSLFSYLRRLL